MAFLKNRDIIISVIDTNNNNAIIKSVTLFVKKIKYDIKPSGATFFGTKIADTLQWYSSIIDFDIDGDSYINPYTIPTLIKADENIKKLYELYMDKFIEGKQFQIGRYKVRLKIKNCPIGVETFEGVFTRFNFDEDDDRLGLIPYSISISAKSTSKQAQNNAIEGFLTDLFIGSA